MTTTPDAARALLEQSEARFRLLVESVRDYAIFMLDTTGHVMTWNAGAERIKGYRADEIIGQHFSRFYPLEEMKDGRCPKCDMELEVAARDGRFEDEGFRIRKDGTRFWANVVITALRDHSGTLVGFAKVTRDLTERVKAEEARVRLAETEAASRVKDEMLSLERAAKEQAEDARRKLATTLESIGDAVITTDREGRVTTMNEVAATLTGYALSEARGLPLREVFRIVNEETRLEVESPVERVLREGVIVGLANHTIILRRDGTSTPISDSGAPIRDERGDIHGVVLVFRDATHEKAEAAQHRFLVEATTVLSSSLDYDDTLERIAQLAVPKLADWCGVELLEGDPPTLQSIAVAHVDRNKVKLARELSARYPADPSAARGVANVIRTGRSELYADVPDELLAAVATDSQHLKLMRDLELHSVMVVPLTAGGRVLGAMTFVYAESRRRYGQDDVTFAEEVARRAALAIENARLYAGEQRARQAADAANRAKDEFLATVSHELRTPLTSIVGWSKMLTSAKLDPAQLKKAHETIERNATSMTQLIEDLLDVSRIVSGKMRIDVRAVSLVTVIDSALEAIRPAIDAKGIKLERSVDEHAGVVLGDAGRLQQVVWNLVSNAVKFTPRGGTVSVVLTQVDDVSQLVVSDTGKGIGPRFLPFVFEPFRQGDAGASRTTGGLGLGLGITKHIVELHGGSVEATSEGEGKGATFTVRIPTASSARKGAAEMQAQSTAPASGPHAVEPLPQLKGLRVVVVDDDDDARALLSAVLAQCGSVVRSAPSVADAMREIEADPPDVLVSDIGMPFENGYDLIRRVRALPPSRGGNMPAAALTAYARAEDRNKALKAGFTLHVPKPIDPGELIAVVAELARLAHSS